MSRTRALAAAAAAVLLFAFAVPLAIAPLAGQRLRQEAARRGVQAKWRQLRFGWDGRVRLAGLELTRPAGDAHFEAESVTVALHPWSLLIGRARLTEVRVSRATAQLPRRSVEPDTLIPVPERGERGADPRRAERIRQLAGAVVRLALTPAREQPALALRDFTLRAPPDHEGKWSGLRIDWLESRSEAGGLRLAAVGAILGEAELPVEISLRHDRDDRVHGGLRIIYPERSGGGAREAMVEVDGAITQDRDRGRVIVHDSTRFVLGKLPFRLGVELDQRGPGLQLRLEAREITEKQVLESLPSEVLGPLELVRVTGTWDYRLALALDLSQPDSVRFDADVTPHGLALDPYRTRLHLLALDQPFVAAIHLPRDRRVERELSTADPSFRQLEEIAPALVKAVLVNEDGAFFRHHGFNTEAMREAIAENLKAGAFRRGAGTITMQVARNLYLGHERTLSRKFREVVLAWILEHLSGVTKERLLEIYFNIIEWGPDIHGAAQAARYYFDRDPAALTVDESLFLATVVPAPSRWRVRFDSAGRLRAFERAQMHFIGRAMVAKGWLAADALPPSDSLRVELRGPARESFSPDSAAPGPPAETANPSLESARVSG